MRSVRLSFVLIALLGSLLTPALASAWMGDFFDGEASGQAVYESAAIHPQAITGPDGTTYVVYQGAGMHPNIVTVSADGTWTGPVRIGLNPLAATDREPDDTHGAPAIVVDAEGHLHVYWGAHLSRLRHARSVRPYDITEWAEDSVVPPHRMSYCQPFLRDDGTIVMSYRLDQDWKGFSGGSWLMSEFTANGSVFSTATAIVRGDAQTMWYGNTVQGDDGRVHGVFLGKNRVDTPFDRYGVYYLSRDLDGVWRDIRGAVATVSPSGGIARATLDATTSAALVYAQKGERQNQAIVAEGPDGTPGVLFTTGSGFGADSHRWVFSAWRGSGWATETVAATDHSFDAAALHARDGGFEAFLTVGGSAAAGPSASSYEDRGGDIVRYRTDGFGCGWSNEETVAAASWSTGIVYNDPQIVSGHHEDGPRLLFGEWNNDGANFVHRVFLWGEDGYRQREFFPALSRLSGANRYEVAAEISRRAFPLSPRSDADKRRYAILVSGESFADALAGGPLATAYGAPILLTSPKALPAATASELARLKVTDVFVLGGNASVSAAVEKRLAGTGVVKRVVRLGGHDRYATAQSIAKQLRHKAGRPAGVFVVSGQVFADGLAAGSVAAARSWPVLLVRESNVPTPTAAALTSAGASNTIVVGGPATVSDKVLAALPGAVRVAGADRYETAEKVAVLGLDGSSQLPPTLTTGRILVATGEVFPDALTGSAFAARVRGPLLLSASGALPAPSERFLRTRAFRVLDCYLIGGERSLDATVAGQVADALRERQAD